MKNIPHGLNIGLEYEILNQPKVKLHTASMEGYITLGNGRTKVTLPMRSWVQNFLDRLYNIFVGNTTDIGLSSASAGTSGVKNATGASINDRCGIILGNDRTAVALSQDDLIGSVSYHDACQYKQTQLTPPYIAVVGDSNELITKVSRTFTNASATGPWTIYEAGIKTKKTASTASNAGVILVSRDAFESGFYFDALTDTKVDIELKATLPKTGGPTLNLLRLFYNLYFKGSANASTWVPRAGSITVVWTNKEVYATSAASNALVIDGGSAKYYGIVVGYSKDVDPTDPNAVSPDITGDGDIGSDAISLYTTSLTYGANTVGAVTLNGPKASFYVTRDITNSSTSIVKIDRITLMTKGNTTAPTGINNDMIPMCVNKPLTEKILLNPNQTLRITYYFDISVV